METTKREEKIEKILLIQWFSPEKKKEKVCTVEKESVREREGEREREREAVRKRESGVKSPS